MMKRRYSLLAALLLATMAMAAPVSKDQARKQAAAFALQSGHTLSTSPQAVHQAPAQQGQTSTPYYIFDLEASQGFVIVSGDNRTDPILGYTESGSFDEESMPENLRAWLDGYAQEIASLDQTTPLPQAATSVSGTTPTAVPMALAAIQPLLPTLWNQGTPYNNLCPVINGSRCPTGCTCTAITQIMYYHQWPQDATTAIPSYSWNAEGSTHTLEALPATVFDWSSMRTTYNGNETSEQAVATLMQYVGQAIHMGYSPSGSGAGFGDVYTALKEYFGYDKNLRHLYRSDYTIAGWADVVYNELANQRPVLYAGSSSGGAHAFVADGYDGQGLFHINWGWGGMCNGYFKLSVLNPDDNSGIGASASHDGYAMGQDIIVGIQPPTGAGETAQEIKVNFSELYVDGTQIVYDVWNSLGVGTHRFNYGLAVVDDSGNIVNVFDYWTQELASGYGFVGVKRDVKGKLSAGTYKVVPVSKVDGTSTWYPNTLFKYIEVTVSSRGSVTLVQHPITDVAVTDFTFPGNHVAGKLQNVQITVANRADEVNRTVYLFASPTTDKGSRLNWTALVVAAGEEETLTLYFTPEEAGTYNVWIALAEDGSQVIGQTTLEVLSAPTTDADLSLESVTLTKGNPTQVTLTVRNNGRESYLNKIDVLLWKGNGGSYGVASTQTQDNINLAPATSQTFTFDLPTTEAGSYMASIHYYKTFGSNNRTEFAYPGNFNSERWFSITDADLTGPLPEDLTDNGGLLLVSHTAVNSSEGAEQLTDNDLQTKYCAWAAAGEPVWLLYGSTQKARLTSYMVASANDAQERDPKTWLLQGSNDSRDWETLDSRTNEVFNNRHESHTYSVSTDKAYGFFRLYVIERYGASSNLFQLAEWQLFGENEGAFVPTAIQGTEAPKAGNIGLRSRAADGRLTVTGAQGLRLVLTDMAGRVLSTTVARSDTEPLDLSTLPSGCYIVRVGSRAFTFLHR